MYINRMIYGVPRVEGEEAPERPGYVVQSETARGPKKLVMVMRRCNDSFSPRVCSGIFLLWCS